MWEVSSKSDGEGSPEGNGKGLPNVGRDGMSKGEENRRHKERGGRKKGKKKKGMI